MSELLGKETIDTNTYGRSRGRNGSYSTNYQLSGRDLMTPDEVRMLDNRYALLFIRGERPVMDLKYDILKHPNVRFTTDGGVAPYKHGEDTRSVASVSVLLDKKMLAQADTPDVDDHNFVLFCEEELEEYFKTHGGKQNENQ